MTEAGTIEQRLGWFREQGQADTAEALKQRVMSRMWDVSGFMKSLKGRFTQWYNRLNGRKGTLWEERFKSVLVEGVGRGLATMAAYIDLNPVRAGLVEDPKDYRWCGYGEALGGGGRIEFRAKVNVVWCLTMLAALIALVHLDGIRGAAVAQIGVFVAYAAVYATAGVRRAGAAPRTLWHAIRPILLAVGLQAAATWAALAVLEGAGAPHGLAAVVAAMFGTVVMATAATRGSRAPLREAIATVRMATRSATP